MKKTDFRILAIPIVLILILSATTILPNVNATFTTSVPTHAWVSISSSTVGLGQSAEIVMFLTEISMDANGSGVNGPGNNIGTMFTGYTLTITLPDGTNKTMGPYTADPISNAYISYTPTELGTYKLQMSYPGQWINDTPRSTTAWPSTNVGVINLYYQPSISNVATFTVTQETTANYQSAPLPTDYWTNPVNAQNREWSSIMGDWLLPTGPYGTQVGARNPSTDRYQPYGTAPTSGHIVWKKSIAVGGTVGGNLSDNNYYTGQSYEVYFNPIIIDGTLYYSNPQPPAFGFFSVDLRTGQTNWYKNDTSTTAANAGFYSVYQLTLGQVLLYETGNQAGAIPYLWYCSTGRYAMLNAFNGDLITTFNNSVAGSAYTFDAQGALLSYVIGTNWIACWNSTLCIANGTVATGATVLEWRPDATRVYDWRKGIMWNITTPAPASQALLHLDYPDGVLVTYNDQQNTTTPLVTLTAYNANSGAFMWQKNMTDLFGYLYLFTGAGAMADGVMTISTLGDMTWYGFDVYTGTQLWKIAPADNATAWGTYDMTSDIDPQTHTMFTASYDGIIRAYNVKTGAFLWSWTGFSSGLETPYGDYPFGGLAGTIPMTICDGQLYVATGEHSPNSPLYRGEYMADLNETTGAPIWSQTGWWQFPAISDGYMVTLNGYDNSLYCFGKGQTATTVTAGPAINNPNQVLIQGTVTDQSTGQTCLGTPAAGTSAISDDSMSQWMEYLYQQQPKPTNATGVPVSIDAIDPNGNQVHIGDTHSDSSGHYSFVADQSMLTAGAGTYTITATFSGSNSYFSSTGQTALAYGVPLTPTANPTAAPISAADQYFIPAIAGLFVLIIVVAIVLALLTLRKRP
jgi:hypothetical protein